MCLNVVLEVSAERQHEEGRSEEDGGVRAGIDGGRERGRGWYRKGRGRKREEEVGEKEKRRETRVRVSNVWRPERH